MLYPTDPTKGFQFDKYTKTYLDIKKDITYKRLNKKTQVLSFPSHGRMTTRLSHTEKTEMTAWVLGNYLGLNSAMCYTMAAGHDIGHTPYGHAGENALRKITDNKFKHTFFSPWVLEEVANNGKGIYINDYVKEGIINHSNGGNGFNRKDGVLEESNVMLFSDKFYLIHDIKDIFLMKEKKIDLSHIDIDFKKLEEINELFETNNPLEQELRLIRLIAADSIKAGKVCFTNSDYTEPLNELFSYMYNNIYPFLDKNEKSGRLKEEIFTLYETLTNSEEFSPYPTIPTISLMTNPEARVIYNKIKDEKLSKLKLRDIKGLEISNILKHIKEKRFVM